MLNLAIMVEINAREYPRRTAFIAGDATLTHAELDHEVSRVANGLRVAGIRQGDKVALVCPTNHYFPICYYGILKAGATVVPINILSKRAEFAHCVRDAEAAGFICHAGFGRLSILGEAWGAFEDVEACRHFWVIPGSDGAVELPAGATPWSALVDGQPDTAELAPTQGDDTCAILYTSGTTGRPKGAELTHTNVYVNALVSRQHMSYTPDDVMLVAAPLDHALGQSILMNPGVAAGAAQVLLPRFDAAEVLRTMERYGVTIYAGVPTTYWNLYHYPGLTDVDLEKIRKHWRLGLCGGASIPPELLVSFQEKFGIFIIEGYGLTETTAVSTYNRVGWPQKPGSIGLPIWGCEMRVVDPEMYDVPVGEVGEIVMRGHHIMKGYYKNPKANEEAFRGGWFHSGDLGRRDEDGYYYVAGRLKDMIIRGGFNIYPREVEETLITHPDITFASVIGIPDDQYGESVKAFILVREGADITPEAVIAWSRERMASYAYPRDVQILDALPVPPNAKILKRVLRELHDQHKARTPEK